MTAPFSTNKHDSETCAQLEYQPCAAGVSLHGEPTDAHWWSGWPGAYCLKCVAEDKDEICMAGCNCSCHAAFFTEMEMVLGEKKEAMP